MASFILLPAVPILAYLPLEIPADKEPPVLFSKYPCERPVNVTCVTAFSVPRESGCDSCSVGSAVFWAGRGEGEGKRTAQGGDSGASIPRERGSPLPRPLAAPGHCTGQGPPPRSSCVFDPNASQNCPSCVNSYRDGKQLNFPVLSTFRQTHH